MCWCYTYSLCRSRKIGLVIDLQTFDFSLVCDLFDAIEIIIQNLWLFWWLSLFMKVLYCSSCSYYRYSHFKSDLSQNVSCQLSLCNVFILTGVSRYKWVEVICTWLWTDTIFLFPINPRTKRSKCVKIHIKPTALTFSDVKPIKNY